MSIENLGLGVAFVVILVALILRRRNNKAVANGSGKVRKQQSIGRGVR